MRRSGGAWAIRGRSRSAPRPVRRGAGILAAIHGFGPHVESVINNEGSAFGPRLLDAVRAYQHVVWVPSRSAFAYTGPVRVVPPA